MSETQDILQKRWDAACRVLFHTELGGISGYSAWLMKNNREIHHGKSSISGKDVTYVITEYCEGGKRQAFEEVDYSEKFAPLPTNEVKDIDSLISAVSERVAYTGSLVLGNSGKVERSTSISDSFFMYETSLFADCKYIGYSSHGRLCEDSFGCNGIGESQFCIKCYETFRDKRCFELWVGQHCSDCYYSHNLSNCQDCIFSFNLKNARNCIGNLQLSPEKYKAKKEELLSQMVDELKSKKSIPSLVEIVGMSRMEKPKEFAAWREVKETPMQTDIKPIENAFSKTCSLLLGAPLQGGMDAYAEWLSRHTMEHEECKSCASGKPIYRRDYCNYFILPKERLLTYPESLQLGGKLKLSEKDAAALSLANAHQSLGRIGFFTSEYLDGTNANLIECATSSESNNCYRSEPIIYAKYCGYTFWPRSTQYAFGCDSLLDSEFCINCYHSVKLKRCFEMDSCRDCSDSYFCHNAENCRDCMFCFNVKNLKFAIGNAEVGREKFMEAKEALLKWMNASLSSSHDLKTDIYNVGCAKKKR